MCWTDTLFLVQIVAISGEMSQGRERPQIFCYKYNHIYHIANLKELDQKMPPSWI